MYLDLFLVEINLLSTSVRTIHPRESYNGFGFLCDYRRQASRAKALVFFEPLDGLNDSLLGAKGGGT